MVWRVCAEVTHYQLGCAVKAEESLPEEGRCLYKDVMMSRLDLETENRCPHDYEMNRMDQIDLVETIHCLCDRVATDQVDRPEGSCHPPGRGAINLMDDGVTIHGEAPAATPLSWRRASQCRKVVEVHPFRFGAQTDASNSARALC